MIPVPNIVAEENEKKEYEIQAEIESLNDDIFAALATGDDEEVKALIEVKEEKIAQLDTGSVVFIDKKGVEHLFVAGDKLPSGVSSDGFQSFHSISKATKGLTAVSVNAANTSKAIKTLLLHIFYGLERGEALDLVLVIDATGSMDTEIKTIRDEMKWIVSECKRISGEKDTEIRIGVVAYKDKKEDFVSKVVQPLSNNYAETQKALGSFKVDGGGDDPEAVLDGLVTAFKDIRYTPQARRRFILVGDAHAQKKMVNPRMLMNSELTGNRDFVKLDQAGVMMNLQVSHEPVKVYSVLVSF